MIPNIRYIKKAVSFRSVTCLSSLLAVSLFFNACKEQIPSGLVLSSLISEDTTYISNQPETPQAKKVVVEELTGAACPNCPSGTKLLNDLSAQFPDRIILTAMHSGFLTDPPHGAIYDFRNPDGDALRTSFNEGDPPKPSASFDRVPVATGGGDPKYFILKGQTGGDWITILNGRLGLTTPVNIYLTSTYNASTNKVNVNTKLHFTSDVSGNLALTLYVLESGKKDIQDSIAVELHDYEFNHVLQKIITPISGQPILDSLAVKTQGRVLEKNISFEPNITGINGWNLDNCVIVGIVHRTGASKEVLHASEVHLK